MALPVVAGAAGSGGGLRARSAGTGAGIGRAPGLGGGRGGSASTGAGIVGSASTSASIGSAGTGAGIVGGRIRAAIVGGRAVIVGIVGGRIRARAATRAVTRTAGSAGLDVDARIGAIGGGIAATRTDGRAGPDFAVRIGAVGGSGSAATGTLASAGPDLAVRIGTSGGSGRAAGRRGVVERSSELLPTTAPVTPTTPSTSDRGSHRTGPWLILSIYREGNRQCGDDCAGHQYVIFHHAFPSSAEGIHAVAAHSIEWDEHQCGRANRVPPTKLAMNSRLPRRSALKFVRSVKLSLVNFDHVKDNRRTLVFEEIDGL